MEILSNARGPVIIDAMLGVGYTIFAMGSLIAGLGGMVARGCQFILAGSPWAALWPSAAIASLVVGLNLFANGLREESLRYR